ncbi:YtpR family tRNA-binding protein [Acetoanaerobium noterae]
MKAPLKWLKKYVDIDVDVKSFSDAMTMSGTKVEGYEEVGEDISNVVIGKITSITPHPDADKLIITKIDTGSSEVQIVTGAKNVSVGDIIPVALHGSTLPGGIKIKKGKLRGEVSEGMLCSAKELGIDEKYVDIESRDGILLLRGEYTLGDDVRKALLLND